MTNIVKDDGSLDAKLVLIGEAPGRHEDRIGKPFVGPAGMKLDDWWAGVGLSRSDVSQEGSKGTPQARLIEQEADESGTVQVAHSNLRTVQEIRALHHNEKRNGWQRFVDDRG